MKKSSVLLWTVLVLALVALGLLLDYSLPHHRVVHVNGHEVKRVDREGNLVDENKIATFTRDVYFINTSDAEGGVHVYRNEDTRFGFPFYLKFDSAEVLARAQMLARQPDQLALVTYYGWRIQMLDEFPNAVDIEPWPDEKEPFPVFNTVFFVVLALIVLLVFWQWRQWRKRRQAA